MSVRITDDGSSVYNGINVSTPYEDASQSGVKVEDFLQLMIAQLTNQDFMNPVDDTQYVTQLAQFATMQSMQELSQYSQTSYVSSLVGKSVTVATFGIGGSVNKEVGIVSAVNLSGDSHTVTVNGKQYSLSQIMEIRDSSQSVTKDDLAAANNILPRTLDKGTDFIKLAWDAPVTDESLQGELYYDVYYTDNDSLDLTNLAGVKKATLAAEDLRDGEFTIDGLESGTAYRVSVVVRNSNGDSAVYEPLTIYTNEG